MTDQEFNAEDVETQLIDKDIPAESSSKNSKKGKSSRPEVAGRDKNFDNMVEKLIENATVAGINSVALKDCKTKLTADQVAATLFPKQVLNTITYYFPNMNIDHPVFLLTLSTAQLSAMVMNIRMNERGQHGTNGTNQQNPENSNTDSRTDGNPERNRQSDNSYLANSAPAPDSTLALVDSEGDGGTPP